MSWDEIRERSHDYAWRNTTQDRAIDFADIIREVGGEDDYIEYERTIIALRIEVIMDFGNSNAKKAFTFVVNA